MGLIGKVFTSNGLLWRVVGLRASLAVGRPSSPPKKCGDSSLRSEGQVIKRAALRMTRRKSSVRELSLDRFSGAEGRFNFDLQFYSTKRRETTMPTIFWRQAVVYVEDMAILPPQGA